MAGGDAAAVLQPADATLDHVARPVRFAVEIRGRRLAREPRDHRPDAPAGEVPADRRGVIPLVGHDGLEPRAGTAPARPRQPGPFDQLAAAGRLVPLAGSDRGGQRHAVAVRHEVQLGREAAPAAAEGMVGRLTSGPGFFPPPRRRCGRPARPSPPRTMCPGRSRRRHPAAAAAAAAALPRSARWCRPPASGGNASRPSTTARIAPAVPATAARCAAPRRCR